MYYIHCYCHTTWSAAELLPVKLLDILLFKDFFLIKLLGLTSQYCNSKAKILKIIIFKQGSQVFKMHNNNAIQRKFLSSET